MKLAAAFTLAVIALAIAFDQTPRCTADSPHGVAIAGVLRIAGCP